MRTLLYLTIILMTASTSWAKKTVCSMTLNSDQEINLFKNSFSKDQWNFVELTDYKNKDSSSADDTTWFTNACKAKVSCDVLVISGHFGGTFFGASGLRLPLETLEKNTCNTDCSGIINNPKEVFLFGCNTLSGKAKDRRSPEEYLNVLRADGFTRQQAEQVVAYRYSLLGDSFAARMSQVFQSSPRIYGFSSIAPSGKTVEPMLKKFLKSSTQDYNHFDQSNLTLGVQKNTKLFSALKDTAIEQMPGLLFLDPARAKVERPYCYLANEKISRLDKLKYVSQVLLSGHALTMIPYIKEFIHELSSQKNQSTEELQILNKISQSERVKSDFNQILSLKGNTYIGLRFGIMSMMMDLKLLTQSEYDTALTQIIDLKKPITVEYVNLICSLGFQTDVNPNLISDENKKDADLYRLLGCLKPRNEDVLTMIIGIMKNDPDGKVRSSAANALGNIKPSSEKIHMMIADVMKNDPDEIVRSSAAEALGQIKPSSEKIHMMIADVMKNDPDRYVRFFAVDALGEFKPISEKFQMMIADVMKNDPDEDVRIHAAYTLGEIKPSSEKIQMMIADVMKNDPDEDVRNHAKKVYENIEHR